MSKNSRERGGNETTHRKCPEFATECSDGRRYHCIVEVTVETDTAKGF